MCTRDALFLSFTPTLGAKVGPKVAPREPKGPQRSPKASPGAPKNHQKIDPGPHLEKRAVREALGVPSGGKMRPKSKKKRIILTPKICKKRPAFRLVFQRVWLRKLEAQYKKRASILSFFFFLFGVITGDTVPKNSIQYNTKRYNAMQCDAVQCTALQCNAMQIECNTIQYNIRQYDTTRHTAKQCNAMQYNRIQHDATRGAQLEKRAAREAPRVPSGRKRQPRSMKKKKNFAPTICHKKRQHSTLLFNDTLDMVAG